MQHTSNESDILFVVKFELGETLSDTIEYRRGDIAEELALEFCNRNDLSINIYPTIVTALEDKYATVQELNEKEEMQNFIDCNQAQGKG